MKDPLFLCYYVIFRSEDSRFDEINRWAKTGGVCFISYNSFRVMIENTSKTARKPFFEAFVNPGELTWYVPVRWDYFRCTEKTKWCEKKKLLLLLNLD